MRNAGAAALQALVTGVMLFLLYRYLTSTLGVEALGLWSIVLATTSAARISELGFTVGVVKFVARHLAHGDADSAARAVETAALALAVFVGALLLLAWWPAWWALGRFLPAAAVAEGRALLPLALLAMWVTTLGGIFQSALDACQRTDLRAAFAILNSVLYLVLAMLLVPHHGLLGLAWVQVALSLLLALLNWLCLRRELPGLPAIPSRWSTAEFKAMLGYGLNIQLSTLLQVLTDPLTKVLLARFGGLEMVGFYEMASRMLMQLRGLLVAPNQVIVPVIARLHEAQPGRVDMLYRESYQLQAYLALPFYAAIAAVLPAFSRLWLGQIEPTFVLFGLLLTAGWFLNGFINPAYFANLGIGRLTWNTWSHVAIGVLNAALGLAAGLLFGGIGVVAAWVVALVLGSSPVLIAFHRERGLPAVAALPRDLGWMAATSLLAVGIAWTITSALGERLPPLVDVLVAGLVTAVLVAVPVWRHPLRRRLAAELQRTARTGQAGLLGAGGT
jgi:O-antigen/teichoic acid export membrane protein